MLKITKSDWYRECVRYSRMSNQKFGMNAIVSLTILVALAVSACLAR